MDKPDVELVADALFGLLGVTVIPNATLAPADLQEAERERYAESMGRIKEMAAELRRQREGEER